MWGGDWTETRWEIVLIGAQTYIGHVLVSVNPFRDRECYSSSCESKIRLTIGSGYLHRRGTGLLPRKEPTRNPASCLRRR